MDAKLIIQARIDELDGELQQIVRELTETLYQKGVTMSMKDSFERMNRHKDQILSLRSAIAELKNIKELV